LAAIGILVSCGIAIFPSWPADFQNPPFPKAIRIDGGFTP
jgi:hypothetical protein